MTRRFCFLLLLFFIFAVSAQAVPNDDAYMRLARLSYLEGNVSYQHTADVDWSAASVNLPLEPGDRIYTGYDGRAEIEFDDGSIFRLAHSTDVEILSLREERIQIRVLTGLSTLIVSSDLDFEINTPVAAFTALRKGIYRFGVDESGSSDAVVRKGELEAANDAFSRRVQTGQMVRIAINDTGNPQYSSYSGRDEWDEWNDRRNADMNAYAGRRYVPDNVYIGVYDLHRHGHWVNVDSYGAAWVPYGIGVAWSPYSVGRWCYRPFYGWTWVSYEPWGWLPYHYGRWYRSSLYGWCWLPGPAFAFNFWSPALVTFYSGPSWISWCPLGPGDYYNVNRYYYNRGRYGHQVIQLRALSTRAPGHPYYLGDRRAFRTANTDQFRNGSFGDRGRNTAWRNIEQPWREGQMVRDRLALQPTATSFRPDPDRRATGPDRIARPLPTVVRNSPAQNLRGQEQFRRITNSSIPDLPSRAERISGEQTRGQGSGAAANTSRRVMETPQQERGNPGVVNLQGNTSSGQSGRRMTTYRWTGTTETNNRRAAGVREQAEPSVRSESNAEQRSSSGVRSESPVQEQRSAGSDASSAAARGERYYRPNNHTEQQSEANRKFNNRSSDYIESPQPETNRSFRNSRSGAAPSRSAPGIERTPSNKAPSVDSAPSRVAPRQSAPSVNRGSSTRTYSSPSASRSGGNPGSSSTGRSSGSNSSKSSGEGQAQGRGPR